MMNCEHCEKKLSDVYFTDNVKTKHVNEVGQQSLKNEDCIFVIIM